MVGRVVQGVLALVVLAILAGGGFLAYRQWQVHGAKNVDPSSKPAAPIVDGAMPVRVTAQARQNMELVVQPITPTTYWRSIEVPGVIIDRPGVSDRGVIAPITGVVTQILSHPGETVEPDAPLFTLRIVSDAHHTSQRELFKATREIEIARTQRKRLDELAQSGALAQVRIIEIDNQIQRLDVSVQAYRQELLARGLNEAQISAASKGEFLSEITVRAPSETALRTVEHLTSAGDRAQQSPEQPTFRFEFQDLKAELGQQVEAGQVLCQLADHRVLLIEGRGFKDDMGLIQGAAKNRLPIEVLFEVAQGGDWPPPPKQLFIHHVENTIDTQTRTFGFLLVLENQWQSYEHDGHKGMLWRFRPGDRVRLKVAIEKIEDVFVLPQAAVVREGPEAYVFRQNGDLFDRRPVHVIAEDRTSVVLANDGSLRSRSYIAQNAAATLNRVLKAQMASGQPTNVHVHADGTTHAAH